MSFYPLLVVIHETLVDINTSVQLHDDPNFIASYHAVIDRDGTITYLVPPDSKAYAAAQSMFIDPFGEQQHINGSVDDFAYHIALETPPDGLDATKKAHTGYTKQQYESLAWLCHATGVANNRIVTHSDIKTIDTDVLEPRCFNNDYFRSVYNNKKTTARKRFNFGVLDING